MTYGTAAMVKERLQETGSSHDTEIASKLTAADALIDLALDPYTTVPVSSPSQDLKELSADVAALLFRLWRAPHAERTQIWGEIHSLIDRYVQEKYVTGDSGGVFKTTGGLKDS